MYRAHGELATCKANHHEELVNLTRKTLEKDLEIQAAQDDVDCLKANLQEKVSELAKLVSSLKNTCSIIIMY